MTTSFRNILSHLLCTVLLSINAIIFLIGTATVNIPTRQLAEAVAWSWITQGIYDIFSHLNRYIAILISFFIVALFGFQITLGRVMDLSPQRDPATANTTIFVLLFIPSTLIWLLAQTILKKKLNGYMYYTAGFLLHFVTIIVGILWVRSLV